MMKAWLSESGLNQPEDNFQTLVHIPSLQQHARLWMALVLVLADLISLFIAGASAVGIRYLMGGLTEPPIYWGLAPFIFVFLAIYALQGLYPAIGLSPVEELRRLSLSGSVVLLFATGFTFWVRTAQMYSRLVFVFAWVLVLILAPLGRWLARWIATRLGVWGEPVAVVGYGSQAKRVIHYLLKRLHLGLRPAVVLTDPWGLEQGEEPPIPVLIYNQREPPQADALPGIRTAILITSELREPLHSAIINRQAFGFHHLILVSDLTWIGSLGLIPHDLEGLLGLEIRQNLLNPWSQLLKRVMDLVLTLITGLVLMPALLLIALLIRLDTGQPTLFRQTRVGKSGREITVIKFRTMVTDAERVLRDYLAENPQAEREWQVNQKLKNDPRITRTGRLLRRFSLDELPQLWNVLLGEMSWGGPRPIMPDQIDMYGRGEIYQRVPPGITGLWQVSGRADTSFEERARFDEYYVRNWSLWLDIHILLRTFWAVLQREGAY
jgi:Undecaprenyl-phosphate galactose phosphotransferase WbaP